MLYVATRLANLQAIRQFSTKLSLANLQMARVKLLFCHGLGASPKNSVSLKIHQWADQHDVPAYGLSYRDYGNEDVIWNVNDWRRDIVNVLSQDDNTKTVIVGSSAGCQAVLRAAVDMPEAIAGLLLFSPGVGVGLDYMDRVLPGSVEKLQAGKILNHPCVDPSLKIKVDMENLLEFVDNCVTKTQRRIRLNCPVRIVHGMKDKLVPFKNSLKLLSQIDSPNKALYLVNDGHFITDRTTIEQALDSLWDAIEGDL
uniref:Hydrolase_4 domain-containing protein n=1 Tax=Panagrellus redivivus TaxID=6233 RepID=A0A7E4VYX7_PANRE